MWRPTSPDQQQPTVALGSITRLGSQVEHILRRCHTLPEDPTLGKDGFEDPESLGSPQNSGFQIIFAMPEPAEEPTALSKAMGQKRPL